MKTNRTRWRGINHVYHLFAAFLITWFACLSYVRGEFAWFWMNVCLWLVNTIMYYIVGDKK